MSAKHYCVVAAISTYYGVYLLCCHELDAYSTDKHCSLGYTSRYVTWLAALHVGYWFKNETQACTISASVVLR